MNVTYAGLPVVFTKELRDPSGLLLNVQLVSYRVLDENDVEVLPTTTLVGYVSGSKDATIEIPALYNQLPANVVQALRRVELTLTLNGGSVVVISDGYVVRRSEPLQVGVNSFQTYAHAQMTALDVPRLNYWNLAGEQEKTNALIQAADTIKMFRFQISASDFGIDRQDKLRCWFAGKLTDLTPDEFLNLPDEFKRRLRLAQVAEAEALLAPASEYDDKRRAGVILDEVGETKMAFSPSIPIPSLLSRDALKYIGHYIRYNIRIAR